MLRVYFAFLFVFSFLAQSVEAQNPLNILKAFQKEGSEPSAQEPATEEIPLTLPVPIDQGAAPKPAVPQTTTPPVPTAPVAPPIEEPEPKTEPAPQPSPTVDDPFGFDTPKPKTETPSVTPTPTPTPQPEAVVEPVPESKPAEIVTPSSAPEALPTPLPSPIEVEPSKTNRPYFGAVVKSLPKGQAGIAITSVMANSPASAAGLQKGDRMLSMADSPVTSETEVKQIMDILVPGDQIELEIYRDGRRMKKLLVVGTTPTTPQVAQVAKASSSNPTTQKFPVVPVPSVANSGNRKTQSNVIQKPRLGITVVDATDNIRSGLRSRTVFGAAVETMEATSPAAAAGLTVGSLIVGVNDAPIRNSTDVVKMISTMKPGQKVNVTFYQNRQLKRTTVVLGSKQVAVQQASATQQTTPRINPVYQPVPGAQFEIQQVERPIMKRIGESLPIVRRVDNLIDRFSPPPTVDPYSQPQIQQVVPAPSTNVRPRSQQAQLEEIIRAQQLQIETMNQRLRQLESRRRQR